MKKKKYLPPILHYICTYVASLALLTNIDSIILISLILWGLSLLICYIETIFVIIPHFIKNKRLHNVFKKHLILEGSLFNALFIVSYVSKYIYKEKKDVLITNVSTIIGLLGYLFLAFAFKNI